MMKVSIYMYIYIYYYYINNNIYIFVFICQLNIIQELDAQNIKEDKDNSKNKNI